MEDWDAVGAAITKRLTALQMTQHELASTSGISPATIRELQHARRRAARSRTLSALSEALGWPAGYLAAVLRGSPPPEDSELHDRASVRAELEAIRTELHRLREQVAQAIGADGSRLAEITARISALEAREAAKPADR